MSNDKKGLLITLEGGEGGGKTTQIVRLKDRLVAEGKDVIVLREPGGTMISEQIREVVLSTKNVGMSFTTEVLLFQAARAQIYREIVLPSLELGKVVYQGMVRGFGVDLIEQLNNISTKKTYANLTFLLDIPVEIGLHRRVDSGKIDRLDMEAKDFHEKVRNSYLTLARKDIKKNGDKARWRIIDASASIELVEEAIWEEVSKLLNKTKTKDWEDQVSDVELEYREE